MLSHATPSIVAVSLGLLLAVGAELHAGDWPQVLGPNRDGVAVGETLPDKLPAGGPKRLWQTEVGEGFAGPAVKGDRVVLFHRNNSGERLDAFETSSGKPAWSRSFPASYRGTIADDNGPRCVPIIHDGAVYAYGAAGDLHCVDFATGKPRWSRALAKECGAPDGYFGAGATPIIASDRLLVNVGGKKGQGLVAVSLKDGKTLWSATDEQASYSAPVLASVEGTPAVLFITRLNLVAVRPEDGSVVFTTPFGARGPTVNGASPIVWGENVFLTASYGIGARWLRTSGKTITTAWEDDDTLSSQYTTPVRVGDVLYGIDGRQDVGTARLRCVDPAKHKVLWTEEGFGMATLIAAGDKVVALKTDGTLSLFAAVPAGYRSLGEAEVFTSTTRALPALSGGKLFARDTRVLRCFEMAR
jgi:outer membrane protein assembly factor BamB